MIRDDIRTILADLYQTSDDARRVASQAGLNVQKINFNGSAVNNWQAILLEADKSDYVPNVLEIAQSEYPNNVKLHETCKEYYRQRQMQNNSDSEISSISKEVASAEISKLEIRLESPYGTVAPISPFYIERQADRDCKLYFQPDLASTVFIKGPREVGKSSLMQRINYLVKEEQDVAVVYISLQSFEKRLFDNLNLFLTVLCGQIGDMLNVSDEIDYYWASKRRSALVKCSNYMSEYILPSINKPIILAIDEMEKLFDVPFRNDFFGMLRTWHNDRAHDPKFQRLSLFLSSSTEPHLFIDNQTQSPFNVARTIELNDLTLEEIWELNRRYKNPLNDEQALNLMELLNGHPFLTHLAIHTIALQKRDPEALFQSASMDEGLFYEHLSRLWQLISESSELTRSIRQICRTQKHSENRDYYRLKGVGLIRRVNGDVVMRNKLYEQFFAERLG